jgi:hypothetical protein
MWYRPLEQIQALALVLALEKVQALASASVRFVPKS